MMLEIHQNSFPGAEEIIPALQRLKQQHGVEFTLVGAGARNVWLHDFTRRNPAATKDADFALFATNFQEYEKVKSILVKDMGFDDGPRLPLTMLSPSGVQVDFLPYGPIEVNHEIPLPGFERAAEVHGLAEACTHAIPVFFRGESAGKVVTPAGLVKIDCAR